MGHPWRSKGEKRTVVWEHEPDESLTAYLRDMQDAIRYALQVAYRTSVRDPERIPSPIALRRDVRDWFNSRYDYARHHVNPVCRTAVAMLKSCKKNHHGELRIPEVKHLAMRGDFTKVTMGGGQPALVEVGTQPLREVVRIQNDFSRRRRALQKHVRNPQKRAKKLRETRGRQRNRIEDALQKLSAEQVKQNPDASFVFENLKGIRRNREVKSKKLRTYLNRWPYRLYQSMVEYKSQNLTLYVSPRGTSTECPVCGVVESWSTRLGL